MTASTTATTTVTTTSPSRSQHVTEKWTRCERRSPSPPLPRRAVLHRWGRRAGQPQGSKREGGECGGGGGGCLHRGMMKNMHVIQQSSTSSVIIHDDVSASGRYWLLNLRLSGIVLINSIPFPLHQKDPVLWQYILVHGECYDLLAASHYPPR